MLTQSEQCLQSRAEKEGESLQCQKDPVRRTRSDERENVVGMNTLPNYTDRGQRRGEKTRPMDKACNASDLAIEVTATVALHRTCMFNEMEVKDGPLALVLTCRILHILM